MAEFGYDAKKMPLGKLSLSSIRKGYDVLKRITDFLEGNTTETLEALSSEFYTVIPHNFGFKKMNEFVIRDSSMVKDKLEMLESLSDVRIATDLMAKEVYADLNPVDRHYRQLKCILTPVDHGSKLFNTIETYLYDTHSSVHNQFHLKLLHIFEIERKGEKQLFEPFQQFENRRLLWHGSRLMNWVGILSKGLRIAPPEAPHTGYELILLL
jgi:poly [ADP-ribose] polymerase